MSVVVHLILGLTFAMLLNSKLVSPFTRSVFRVVYILPWVFTASIIAILWRLMLNPNGVINYLLEWSGLVSQKIEWLSSRQLALHAVTFINIWSGYPFYMVSLLAGLQGIPDEIYEAGTIDGANGPQLFRYVASPTAAHHHQPRHARLYLDHAAVYADLDDDGRRAGPRDGDAEYVHL